MEKISKEVVESYRKKLLQLYEGVPETSGKLILGFTKIFGVVPLNKFDECMKFYQEFVTATYIEEYGNSFCKEELTEERELFLSNKQIGAIEGFIRAYTKE